MALFHLLPILFILLSTSSFITAEITCASDETLPPLSQFTDLNNTITEALGWANTDAAIPPYGTPDAWITIPVYYHNLKFNCPCPGNIGDDIIRRHVSPSPTFSFSRDNTVHLSLPPSLPPSLFDYPQHNFLNDAFRSLYIRFDLRAIVWHNNQDLWFQRALNDNNIAGDMYSRTRRGDYKTLNVYYVGGPGNPKDGVVVVGKGTFPRVAPNAAERKVDGVMVRWETSPGLNIYGWDLVWKGKTAIRKWFRRVKTWRGWIIIRGLES